MTSPIDPLPIDREAFAAWLQDLGPQTCGITRDCEGCPTTTYLHSLGSFDHLCVDLERTVVEADLFKNPWWLDAFIIALDDRNPRGLSESFTGAEALDILNQIPKERPHRAQS